MKTTELKFNNYFHDTENKVLYLGIPEKSSPEEIDAFISLLFKKLEIKHSGRTLEEIKKVGEE